MEILRQDLSFISDMQAWRDLRWTSCDAPRIFCTFIVHIGIVSDVWDVIYPYLPSVYSYEVVFVYSVRHKESHHAIISIPFNLNACLSCSRFWPTQWADIGGIVVQPEIHSSLIFPPNSLCRNVRHVNQSSETEHSSPKEITCHQRWGTCKSPLSSQCSCRGLQE